MKKFFSSHDNDISVAYIWIIGGSNLDNQNQKGINQILCSLITRGSKTIDNFGMSNILDFNGAELNYEASHDGIYIGVRSLKEYFKNIYPLLDMIVNEPNLSEKEFIKSKKHQINYLIKSKENLFTKTFDNWSKIVYRDHPYSFDSNGYINTINNINYDDILKEYDNFKLRNKYLLTNHKINNLMDIKSNNINQIKPIDKTLNSLSQIHKKRYIHYKLSTNQVIIMLGNKTCPHNSEDYLSLKLLESYLSFGMSSLLFKVFREENGLTYDVGVINSVRIEKAPFLIYLSVSSQHAKLAFKLLINLWNEISTNYIPLNELNLAKTKLKNAILNSHQTIEEIVLRKVQLIGYQMDPYFDINSLSKLETINPEMLYIVINKYFKKPYLSLLGESKTCNVIKCLWEEMI